MTSTKELPPMARYPESTWRHHMMPEEWDASLDAWISLAEAHLLLNSADFERLSSNDESLVGFLSSYTSQAALPHILGPLDHTSKTKSLRRVCFLLTKRLLESAKPPDPLLSWNFLADMSKAYGKSTSTELISTVWKPFPSKNLEISLASLKSSLIAQLEADLKGNPKELEQNLKRLHHLLHSSVETCVFFMSGTDFLDGLISCYKLMNPPLRKAIITTTYLCLIGLTEGSRPNFSLLTDQLYSLKTAAEAYKVGPTNEKDSLVAELVTVTPILRQTEARIEASGTSMGRVKSVISALRTFRRLGASRPKRLIKRKIDKGTGTAQENGPIGEYEHEWTHPVHVHRMSLISQVQDLFSDLGSGFVLRLLDEYDDNVEEVTSHLLEGSLPAYLEKLDRAETLSPTHQATEALSTDMAPRSTPPLLPTRRNIFDDDEFDKLALDTSRFHFGRKNPQMTADDILRDQKNAPNKAAILSALAAFDSDDDERDDTYDVQDVGGTVDSATPGNIPTEAYADTEGANDEALFRAFKMAPDVFDRDSATRRGKPRIALRKETRMTDEAIEGWALMLSRDPRRLRRLEARLSIFSGAQRELVHTAWIGDNGGSATEDTDTDGGGRGRGRGDFSGHVERGRGGGSPRGGRVAGPAGDKDTEIFRRKKEANKGSRANHNRKDAAARKMARGGFAG